MRRGGYACIALIPFLLEDYFMKRCYYLALAPIADIIPLAADMYCEMNIVGGGNDYAR